MRLGSTFAIVLSFAVMAWTVAADGGVRELSLSLPAKVRIEAGWFAMGSDDADLTRALELCAGETASDGACTGETFEAERPAHRVHVRAFTIDRTEVSNAAYERCVNAGACLPAASSASDPRVGQPLQPVAAVSWRDARAYCKFAGGDLPTEAQWEYAARGGSKRQFPWGQVWNTRLANHAQPEGADSALDGFLFAAPVTAFPDGRSFYGLQNMAGNVWELVRDYYSSGYPHEGNRIDPEGPSKGSERVIRGGSWRSPPHELRASFRGHIGEDETRPDVGMRCAY
jgi:sulfatase modifying factor 1